MSGPVTHIAMWSGPRNISTAMMYSFGNRPDCYAWDEPFYAFSLKQRGNDHPMRDEIIAAHESDWDKLVATCLGNPPGGKTVFYQKHMTHHMLPGFDRSFAKQLTNAFLIRDPARVLASYTKKWSGSEITLTDIGFAEQMQIFDSVADDLGHAPPVVDSDDILRNPRGVLTALCASLNIPFSEDMLKWNAGPREFDGVWASHWYNAVWASTGFEAPSEEEPAKLPDALRRVEDQARPLYEKLRANALSA